MTKPKVNLSNIKPINNYIHLLDETQKSFLQKLCDKHLHKFEEEINNFISKNNYKTPKTPLEKLHLIGGAPDKEIENILNKHI